MLLGSCGGCHVEEIGELTRCPVQPLRCLRNHRGLSILLTFRISASLRGKQKEVVTFRPEFEPTWIGKRYVTILTI